MATRDRRPLLIGALFVLLFVSGLGVWPAARSDLCPSILIASSSEKASLMSTLAGDYSASHRNTWAGCGDVVRVEQMASGDAERALAQGWPDTATRPVVWAPAATTWVELLRHDVSGTKFAQEVSPPPWQPIATSPLIVAMPDVMARALGWPGTQPSWSDLLALAANPNGWATKGHPEFGPFRLGKTDPTKSTSGIHTLITEYYAATGDPGGLTLANVNQAATQKYLDHIEASVSHYAPTAGDFLSDLSAVGGDTSYVSAIPVEEQEVFNYNTGVYSADHLPPIHPLDAVYPTEGTLFADHPYVILSGGWVSQTQRMIANDFKNWLLDPARQDQFAAAGFRDSERYAGADLTRDSGIIPSLPTRALALPTGSVLAAIVRSWTSIRKPARILIVLALGTGGERDAVRRAVGDLGAADAVGVMVSPPRLLADMTVLTDQGRATVENAIASAPLARGPTPLYATIEAAYRQLSTSPDASRINAVVVIASVPNAGPTPALTELERELLKNRTANVPVRIYTVALGGADRTALTDIERSAGGSVSSSPDPSSAIRTCLANF